MAETKEENKTLMEEIWKDIEGYEGLYQVSNMGNVRSLNYHNEGKAQILRPQFDCAGYRQVSLYKDRKKKSHKIHRLVAQAFIPNPDELPCINHIDEDKINNRVDNLEWCDHAYNNNYGTHNERIANAQRNNRHQSKQVRCVETGEVYPSQSEASRRTGIFQCHISDVCCKKPKRKTAGGFHWEYVTSSSEK